jgi:hypothetical protein
MQSVGIWMVWCIHNRIFPAHPVSVGLLPMHDCSST